MEQLGHEDSEWTTDGIGVWAADLGSAEGQERFWFTPKEPVRQEELFAEVAGILLRSTGRSTYVRALYLYPQGQIGDGAEAFTLLLRRDANSQGDAEPSPSAEAKDADDLSREYSRMMRLVIAQLADTGKQHHPQLSD